MSRFFQPSTAAILCVCGLSSLLSNSISTKIVWRMCGTVESTIVTGSVNSEESDLGCTASSVSQGFNLIT